MAQNRRFPEELNNSIFEHNEVEAIAQYGQDTYDNWLAAGGTGYYTRTCMTDVINNFIVSHVGEGKVLSKVPRHEVAYWAQRTLQEFSYDILHSEHNIEIEIGPSLSFPLPSDYVNYVKLVYIDPAGNDRVLIPKRWNNAKQAINQDSNFEYVYDTNGEAVIADESVSTQRFQNPDLDDNLIQARRDTYGSLYTDDIYDYYYSGYFGRRYGLEPENENFNGAYQIDLRQGIVYLDGTFQEGDIIGFRYISDGLRDNGDLDTVYVPKLAEDAIYASILYNLVKVRTQTVNLAPMYKKEAMAKMRNAKIRLSNYKTEEIAQVMRQRAKWIKH